MSLALLIGCAAGAGVRDVVVQARAQGQNSPSYEYNVVHTMNEEENDKEVLAKFGRAGWRFVAVSTEGPHRKLYFERALPR